MSDPISAPLPEAREGEPAWILSAEELNRMVDKIEAFYNIVADPPLKIVKSDAGFKFTQE